MPSRQDCENEIIAAGNGALNRDDAQALLRKFSDRMKATDDPIAMAREIGDEATAAALIEKRNRLMNLRKRMEGTDLVERQYPVLKDRHGKESLYLALQSKISGINTVVERGKDSAEALAYAKRHVYLSSALQDLEKLGTFDSFRNSPAFQDDVGRELYEQSMAANAQPHRIGLTGNKQAQNTAEAIFRWQSLAKSELNGQGAWIGDLPGYISRTTWDPAKLWKADYAQWRQDMMRNLDQAKTFEGSDDPEAFLHAAFDNLRTGIHITDAGRVGLKDPAFTGPSNLAKRLSESRDFHFRDADAWMEMQKKYGIGQLPDQILRSLDRAGSDFALLNRFGTNPRAEMEAYIDRFVDRYHHTDPEAAQYLNDNRGTLMRQFGYLDGTNNRPENQQWSRIGQGLRNLESLGKLGALTFTHAFSMGTIISKMKYATGLPWAEVAGNAIASLGRGSGDRFGRGELHDLLLSNIDGRSTDMMQHWTPGEHRPGLTSSMLSTFLRWQGFNYVMNSFKAGARDMAARDLGMQVDRTYAELKPETQRSLVQYGITPGDWEVLRNAPDHTQVAGRTYLTPDAAHRAEPDNELFRPDLRQALAMKLYTYFDDAANESIVTPGVREHAQFFQGMRPGTAMGEVARFVAQFKMWGAANLRQNVGREWYGNPGSGTWGVPSKSQLLGITSLAAMSTILGYGRMATVSLMKGETPRNPLDPHTILAAAAQGGGFGILGDFLFGQQSRTGQGLGETLLGPVIGTGLQLFDLKNKMTAAAEGDRRAQKDLGPEALKVVTDNAPFINMWGVRTALNYAFLWRLQEMLNPGFQRRRERRIQRETGQTMILSPAAAVQ